MVEIAGVCVCVQQTILSGTARGVSRNLRIQNGLHAQLCVVS